MRAFMLLPAPGGLRQVELDVARADIDREIELLRRLFGPRGQVATTLDQAVDAGIEKLRGTHSEMAAALASHPEEDSAPRQNPPRAECA